MTMPFDGTAKPAVRRGKISARTALVSLAAVFSAALIAPVVSAAAYADDEPAGASCDYYRENRGTPTKPKYWLMFKNCFVGDPPIFANLTWYAQPEGPGIPSVHHYCVSPGAVYEVGMAANVYGEQVYYSQKCGYPTLPGPTP